MSGHSKWSTIKRKKGALDAKRGKLFTKLIKEISIAVREGGDDPASNPRLRLAIQNAKGVNMPKENIDRAVKKGSATDSENYFETTYEGYGPNGIPVFVECTTDNINRTVQNVRFAFSKWGGSLGTNGSLEFMFDRKGIFNIIKPQSLEEDDFTFEVIDAGAEEVEFQDDYIHIICALEDFGKMQRKIEELGLEPEVSELHRVPKNRVELDNEALQKVIKLIEVLEDDDDVQKVYHNIDIKEDQYEFFS
ncbi:MAG: YebC/PmpR family DNA-binding transcriptional regulator [Bacteroidota bacterium]|nr:YebC/PmpR family DNA-binding transcriptional regulator [Bacteroidota bacterium]